MCQDALNESSRLRETDPEGIPTNTPDQFPAQAEGLGGP